MTFKMGEENGVMFNLSDSVFPEAAAILVELSQFWDEVSNRTGPEKGKFLEKIFMGMWEGNDTGDEQESILNNWVDDQPDETQPLALLQASFTSCAYAVQSIRAQSESELLLSWQTISKSNYWLGIVIGTWSLRKVQPESIKDFAKRGAVARHAEHRAMKVDAFKWLDENMVNFKSMSSAAETLSRKIVPMKYVTTQNWVSQWTKLRSTGKP